MYLIQDNFTLNVQNSQVSWFVAALKIDQT